MVGNCLACESSYRLETHHVRTRGSGGGNEPFNLIILCSGCHTQEEYAWHRGWKRFLAKFPHVQKHLESQGWEVFNGKLISPRKIL